VTTQDGAVFVDGVHMRTGGPKMNTYAKRGGRASKARRVQK
jgi:hypothetical protein